MSKIMKFEKYAFDKEKIKLEHSFELIQFVEKLNEYIIRYYQDNIYSYILRKRMCKLHGKELSDEKFNEIINYDLTGNLMFPSIGSELKTNENVNKFVDELTFFVDNISFNETKFRNIIEFTDTRKIGIVLPYEDCIKSAREVKDFEKNRINDYINKVKSDIKKPEFSFLYQLHDFMNRLISYYDFYNKEQEAEKVRTLKRDIKPLD